MGKRHYWVREPRAAGNTSKGTELCSYGSKKSRTSSCEEDATSPMLSCRVGGEPKGLASGLIVPFSDGRCDSGASPMGRPTASSMTPLFESTASVAAFAASSPEGKEQRCYTDGIIGSGAKSSTKSIALCVTKRSSQGLIVDFPRSLRSEAGTEESTVLSKVEAVQGAGCGLLVRGQDESHPREIGTDVCSYPANPIRKVEEPAAGGQPKAEPHEGAASALQKAELLHTAASMSSTPSLMGSPSEAEWALAGSSKDWLTFSLPSEVVH